MTITWRCAPFAELTPREVHDLLQARSAAFVVEQKCIFLDIDGIDPQCWHVVGHSSSGVGEPAAHSPSPLGEGRGEGAVLVATARLVPPGTKFAEPSIGRVVTTSAVRGTGVGRALMIESIAQAQKLWPRQPLRVAAQEHLERFYASLGFVATRERYMEDGIPHVDMVRPPSTIPDRSGQTVGQ